MKMRTASILTLAALGAVSSAAVSSAMAASSCAQVTSPNIGKFDNVLASVSANSASDIWAVGQRAPETNQNQTITLIQHFDGSTWSVVPSPNVGSLANALVSVSANSGSAWAVGYYLQDLATPQSLIEAWNGEAWKVIDHPHVGANDWLFSVSAVSPGDVWAAGYSQGTDGVFRTLIEHFDGHSWSVVSSPNPGATGNQLQGIAAISSTSVWAVGQQFGNHEPDQAVIEHWDGATWSVIPPPADGQLSNLLYKVAGVSDAAVRVAGEAGNNLSPTVTLLLNGKNGSFSIQPSLNVGSGENHLYGITSVSDAVAWAVGEYVDAASGNLFTLVLTGGASGWTQVPSPNPGSANGNSELSGVTVVDGTTWAVGTFDGASAQQTLILRCQ